MQGCDVDASEGKQPDHTLAADRHDLALAVFDIALLPDHDDFQMMAQDNHED